MPLEIIGAGFGRTGTDSTRTALNQLGFPCYHALEMIENKANKSHLDFWNKVANEPAGKQHDWEQVFHAYRAGVDNPVCPVWRELLVAYPDAKVLLTLHPRGPEAWYESALDTIYATETMWQWKLMQVFLPFARKTGNMSRKLVWERCLKGAMAKGKAAAVAQYEAHVAEVRAAVPPERLLVFTVTEGWEPLCKFLGVPVPDTPFPNVNDRAQMKKMIAGLTASGYVILAALALVAAALVYLAVQVL